MTTRGGIFPTEGCEVAPFSVPVGTEITSVRVRDNRGNERLAECGAALKEGETLRWRYGDTLRVYRDDEGVMIEIDPPPSGYDEAISLILDQPHAHDDPDTMVGFGFSVGGRLDLVAEAE